MHSITSELVVAVLCVLFTFQCTVEAKFRSGGKSKSSSSGRGRSSFSTHSSHSSSSSHYSPSNHYNPPSSHQSPSYFPSIHSAPRPSPSPILKPAPPPIGWISSGHSTGGNSFAQHQNTPNSKQVSYPAQTQTVGAHSAVGTQNQDHSIHPSQPHSIGHTPIQATKQNQNHSSYPVQSYHTARLVPSAGVGTHQAPVYHAQNTIPAGTTYYPSAAVIPAGATFYPQEGMVHVPTNHVPVLAPIAVSAGATFYASPAAIPVGATFYPQPIKTSSGPGFGTGFAAGAITQSVLSRLSNHHHYHDRVVHHYDHNNYNNNNNEDRVIIINNGPAEAVQTTPVRDGTTIIQKETQTSQAVLPEKTAGNFNQNYNQNTPVIRDSNSYMNQRTPQAPPISTDVYANNNTNAIVNTNQEIPQIPPITIDANENLVGKPQIDALNNSLTETNTSIPDPFPMNLNLNETNQSKSGGIICIPILVNETDPQSSSNTIAVERIACFKAPTDEFQTNETMSNENGQQPLVGSPAPGNEQSQLNSPKVLPKLEAINNQHMFPYGINHNYTTTKPPSQDKSNTQIIGNGIDQINTPTSTTSNSTKIYKKSSAAGLTTSVGFILTFSLLWIKF